MSILKENKRSVWFCHCYRRVIMLDHSTPGAYMTWDEIRAWKYIHCYRNMMAISRSTETAAVPSNTTPTVQCGHNLVKKKKVHINCDNKKKAKWSNAAWVRAVSAVVTEIWTRPADLNSSLLHHVFRASERTSLSALSVQLQPKHLPQFSQCWTHWQERVNQSLPGIILANPWPKSGWNNLSHLYDNITCFVIRRDEKTVK